MVHTYLVVKSSDVYQVLIVNMRMDRPFGSIALWSHPTTTSSHCCIIGRQNEHPEPIFTH